MWHNRKAAKRRQWAQIGTDILEVAVALWYIVKTWVLPCSASHQRDTMARLCCINRGINKNRETSPAPLTSHHPAGWVKQKRWMVMKNKATCSSCGYTILPSVWPRQTIRTFMWRQVFRRDAGQCSISNRCLNPPLHHLSYCCCVQEHILASLWHYPFGLKSSHCCINSSPPPWLTTAYTRKTKKPKS